MRVAVKINGQPSTVNVEPSRLLVELLRDRLRLTGTKFACETSVCGACTVLLDGRAVKSCTILAVQVDGRDVTTIEGLSADGLTTVQQAFRAEHAVQCGFCTPGMVVSVTALIGEDENPTDDRIRAALEGNLCRCTGYAGILRAVRYAAAVQRGETPIAQAGRALESPLASREVTPVQVRASDVEVV